MNIRRIIKLAASWAIAWIAIGAIVGILFGFGDTGHVGALGTLIILVSAGAIFGSIGGLIFAPLFAWVESHLSAKGLRVVAAIILGALSGVLAIYVADKAVGIKNWVMIGSAAGAVTGLVFGIISPRSHT